VLVTICEKTTCGTAEILICPVWLGSYFIELGDVFIALAHSEYHHLVLAQSGKWWFCH
jgi:hypothetical protein